jgi:hypothetical protein
MKDPVLEQEIEAVEVLIKAWNGLFARANESRTPGSGENGREAAFLEARNALVQDYPEMMSRLEIPVHSDDEVMQILGRLSSLGVVLQMPEPQWKKLCEMQGHIEVVLRGMLGALRGRKRSLDAVSRQRILVLRVLGSWPLKLLYLVTAIVIVFVVLKLAHL